MNPSFRPASPPPQLLATSTWGALRSAPSRGSASPRRRRMLLKDRKQIYFLLFSPQINISPSSRGSPSRGKGAQRSPPLPLRFTGGETHWPNRIRKALVSFLVGVIKSINWLCRQLKMTGVAKKASLIFQSVPSGGGKRAGRRSRLFPRGLPRAGDGNGATAGGTARCAPLKEEK